MKLYRRFCDELKRNPIVGSIAIFSFLNIIILFIIYGSNSNFLESATLTILFITLVVLIWYTLETRKMAIIQHNIFEETKKPLLSIHIDNVDPKNFNYRYMLVNRKPLFTTANVFAKLTMNGDIIKTSDHYNGIIPWQLQPSGFINAPCILPKIVLGEIDDNNSNLYDVFLKEYSDKNFELELIIDYESEHKERKKNPPVKYYFNMNKREWVLKVDS